MAKHKRTALEIYEEVYRKGLEDGLMSLSEAVNNGLCEDSYRAPKGFPDKYNQIPYIVTLEGYRFINEGGYIITGTNRSTTAPKRRKMQEDFYSEHWNDPVGDPGGNPAGGVTNGRGLCISWQNGPLGRGVDRKEPNGAFVETILAAAKDRLEFYQNSKFNCESNKEAISLINKAIEALNNRTNDRESRGVEGINSI